MGREGGGVGWGSLTEMEHKMDKAWKTDCLHMKFQVTSRKTRQMTQLVDSQQKHSWPGWHPLSSTWLHLINRVAFSSPPHLLVFQSDLMHYQMQI